MSKLTNENIKFLEELSKEMREQDNLSTAAPRLWVIRDVKEVPTSDDYADGYQAFDDDNCEEIDSEGLDERVLDWVKEDGEEILNHFLNNNKSYNIELDNLSEWNIGLKVDLLNLFGENIRLVPFAETVFVTDTAGSFLTQKAAQDHINANRHHYTSKVHTYCIHAWRNPEMERLINILEETDWDACKE